MEFFKTVIERFKSQLDYQKDKILFFNFNFLFQILENIMFKTKNKFSSIFSGNILSLFLFLILSFPISINQSYALSHEWVGVPMSEYGEQLWDRKSIKKNEDGSLRVLSKFIPKIKSEITQDIIYTMDINCFEKSFRDVDVFIDEGNSRFKNLADWQDPNGDQLILGVIGQVCRFEN